MADIYNKKFDVIEIQTLNKSGKFHVLLATSFVTVDPKLSLGEKVSLTNRVFISYQDFVKLHGWEARDILDYIITLKEVSTDDTNSK